MEGNHDNNETLEDLDIAPEVFKDDGSISEEIRLKVNIQALKSVVMQLLITMKINVRNLILLRCCSRELSQRM